jgi:4-amino-4-deoxy-L-arabinose transferase-like glycosyltransferase
MFDRYRSFYLPALLTVIIAVALFMRVYRASDYMTFLGDEGRDVMVVKHMIVDGKFTLLGPTASVGGFFMGPVYYYFMAPFLWLSHLDPVGPAIGVGIVGTFTVYLLYMFVAGIATPGAGIVAALLYALSPLVIAYSRSSWNPNIVPFVSLLLVMSFVKLWKTKKYTFAFVAGTLIGIGIQLHYVFLFMAAWYGIMVLVHSSLRTKWQVYILSILGGLVGFSPFLLFEIRHGFMNVKAIALFLSTGKDTGFDGIQAVLTSASVIYRLISRELFRIPDTGMLLSMDSTPRMYWNTITPILTVIFLVWFFWPVFKFLKKRGISYASLTDHSIRLYLIIASWIIVPSLIFGLYRKPIYDYYFGIIFPIPALMAGVVMSRVFSKNRIVGSFMVAILAGYLLMGMPFLNEPNRQLLQAKTISGAVIEHTGGKPFNFALLAGANSDHAYRYFFEIWNRAPVTIEYEGADPERKTITDQLLVVCEDKTCQPIGHPLWEIAGFGRAEIAGQWDISVVRIYRLVHYHGDDTTLKGTK